jgi:predicted RNase H-like HicB family nuclease
MTRMQRHEYTAVIRKRGRSYIAFVEELPGVNTQGGTLAEVRRNLREALRLIIAANASLLAGAARPAISASVSQSALEASRTRPSLGQAGLSPLARGRTSQRVVSPGHERDVHDPEAPRGQRLPPPARSAATSAFRRRKRRQWYAQVSAPSDLARHTHI